MAINLPIVTKFDSTGLDKATTGIERLGTFTNAFAIGAVAAFAAASAAMVKFGFDSLKAADEARKVSNGLEQIAKNSGAFGDSAEGIKAGTKALMDHSTELAKVTGIDDELFSALKRNWLSVPQIAATGAKGLNKLATVAADVSVATGKDLESVGQMFTKAFATPETALAKLQKAGVVLADSQKQVYTSLVDSGKAAEAQGYLVEQLGQKYKGAAEAAASPFEILKFRIEDLQETVGAAILPAFDAFVKAFGQVTEAMQADPEFQGFLVELQKNLMDMVPTLIDLFGNLMKIVQGALPMFNSLLPTVNSLLGIFALNLKDSGDNAASAWGPLINVLDIIGMLADAVKVITKGFNDWSASTGWLKPWIDMIMQALNPLDWMIKSIKAGLQFIAGDAKGAGLTMTGVDFTQTSVSQNRTSGVRKMATGGIVMPSPGGMLANIAEAGKPEAVIPLDRLASMGYGGGSSNNISIVVNAGMGTNGAQVGEQIITAIKKYERVSGPVFASA